MLAEKISKEYAEIFGEMATTQVRNNFHGTQAAMWVDITESTVKASEVDRLAAELCGMSGCTCKSVPMNGDRVVNVHGEEYTIIEG